MNIIIKIYEFLNFILGFLIKNETIRYMAAFFRQVKIGVLTLTLEKKQ